MKLPPFRFIDDGWVFNPFHWLGPDCRVDCYPDKLFHLLAGFAVAGAFAWAAAKARREPPPVWAHLLVVPVVAALKEVYDWSFAQPDPSGFWRDQGPSWRDFAATLFGQLAFWLIVWARRVLAGRGAGARRALGKAAGSGREGPEGA